MCTDNWRHHRLSRHVQIRVFICVSIAILKSFIIYDRYSCMKNKNETIVQEDNSLENKREKKKRRKRHITDITAENDIKFRGPLSYRHLRIIAWLFLAIAQIGVILTMNAGMRNNPQMYGSLPNIFSFFANFMAPLFLIAAFSTVIVAKNGYKRLLILYGGLSVIIYILFIIVYRHFLVGVADALTPGSGRSTIDSILSMAFGNGFIAFNIFIDLFLCALATFFVNYTPKEHFKGKKIYIFRAFVVFPILYEIGSIALKILASTEAIKLSPYFYPLLTTKAPIAFIIFLLMALFVKKRENFFIKKGKTIEEFNAFQKTNANSLHFSIFLSIAIAIGAIIDLIIFLALYFVVSASTPVPEGVEAIEYIGYIAKVVYSWGFGQTSSMILIIPLVLLFDYRKTYKNTLLDMIIPIVGIAIIAIIYIEGGFEVIRFYLRDLYSKTKEEEETIKAAIKQITNIIKRR